MGSFKKYTNFLGGKLEDCEISLIEASFQIPMENLHWRWNLLRWALKEIGSKADEADDNVKVQCGDDSGDNDDDILLLPIGQFMTNGDESFCTVEALGREHFHQLPSTCIHFHPLSSTSIHFHPLSSTFIHFHPLSSTFIHFHPLSSIFIHFHPLSSTFIHFHPLIPNNVLAGVLHTDYINLNDV